MNNCIYCESDLAAYDPVFVERERGDTRREVGAFCNYACLSAWIDEENLVDGACCRIDV